MSILAALLLAAFACAMGFFIGRQSAPGKQEASELKAKLAVVEKAANEYRHDVNQHFQQTAHLLGRLTENHRQLYQHLAVGAHELTQDGQAARLYRPEQLGLAQAELPPAAPIAAEAAMESEHHEGYAQPASAQAPRDYVPHSHGIMSSSPAPQPERV